MILLLTLLSLCATECRVHRADSLMFDSYDVCSYGSISICPIPSHWIRIVEKCDTATVVAAGIAWMPNESMWRYKDSGDIVIRCYYDTLVDSGCLVQWPSGEKRVKIQDAEKGGISWKPIPMLDSSTPPTVKPLDSTELADLREMLREWRVEKCYNKAIQIHKERGSWWIMRDDDVKAIYDSCECVWGGRK